jgi:hypothetical protein
MDFNDRFYQRVEIDENTGCHNWTGNKDKNGYGHIRYKGKQFGTHRISFIFNKGEILPGLFVCHKCDNPACVNPEHLFLGTPADNTRDAAQKGRMAKGINNGHSTKPENTKRGKDHYRYGNSCKTGIGEKNGRAKLSRIDVIEIKNLYRSGLSYRSIAKIFNVSLTAVRYIIIGRNWSKSGV